MGNYVDPRPSSYFRWHAMKARCLNPTHPSYGGYGGRGITVCDRWLIYANFLADMGESPSGTSLDRVDNDGNYCPENCRWATKSQQQNNRRDTRYVGDEPLFVFAARVGVSPYNVIHHMEVGYCPLPTEPKKVAGLTYLEFAILHNLTANELEGHMRKGSCPYPRERFHRGDKFILGESYADFARRHGLSYGTVSYHMLRGYCPWPRKGLDK